MASHEAVNTPFSFISTMPNLIVLIGPTGVGKTELSLRLAENFQTDIVSADSRQLYADLKIGTDRPTPDQLSRRGFPFHPIQVFVQACQRSQTKKNT